MPELIGGLPLHPLVVHFVVVLLPVAAVGSLLTAVWPAVRRRFGWLVVAAAAVATVLVPVATKSGANLDEGLGGGNPLVDEHSALGKLMIWWALGLTIAVTTLMILHRRAERQAHTPAAPEPGGGGVATATQTEAQVETRRSAGLSATMLVAIVATVSLAVGTGVHIYRVGDSGARAVWEDVGQNLK